MNTRFQNYIATLTPSKQLVAREAVSEYLKGDAESVKQINSPTGVFTLCRDLAMKDEEHAVVLLMNRNFGLIKRVEVGVGSQTETVFDIRAIFREALLNKATLITLVHNHPSGSVVPSNLDDKLTQAVKKAGEVMQIRLVDHVIIGNGDYYSYNEQGKI